MNRIRSLGGWRRRNRAGSEAKPTTSTTETRKMLSFGELDSGPLMNPLDHTQAQSDDDRARAQQLSKEQRRPPADIPGYEIQRFLGAGAYGEVWVAMDRNTGRQVALKFYTHRGGLDWSLLSREVEKLVYLSADRYVVQLMEVGWDASPPYYVMEYLEHGSLEDHLQSRGALPLNEALDLFREVAVGLSHAHSKGVLHCDLKPANILLDQDAKPRLADFGQSRLSTEQSPSLGTLFYMAPEQADLKAVPDAKWDVYALGAILYCALVGHPPHRSPQTLHAVDGAMGLDERLSAYRRVITDASAPTAHRKVAGMDGALANLIDRCLAANPSQRLSSVQAVLTELEQREQQRQRRPVLVLGFLGPLLLLLVMSLFGWRSYRQATVGREAEIRERAAEVNHFAARMVAGKGEVEIERYFDAVEQLAGSSELRELTRPFSDPSDAALKQVLAPLSDPNLNSDQEPAITQLRKQLADHSASKLLQTRLEAMLKEHPETASWFVCDPQGTQVAAAFRDPTAASTIGKNYRWRTYFHGQDADLVSEDAAAKYGTPEGPITEPHLSAAFRSTATNRWKVAISAPIRDGDRILGVVALTVDITVFLRFEEHTDHFFAVLIDSRPGDRQGLVLQHPLYEQLPDGERLPDSFTQHRISTFAPEEQDQSQLVADPFSKDPLGTAYDRPWLASQSRIRRRVADRLVDTGLVIQIQHDYGDLVEPVRQLSRSYLRLGMLSLAAFASIVAALWLIVLRVSQAPSATMIRPTGTTVRHTPLHELTTLHEQRRD
ncbi:MAG: serine/threonine protein kinase [Planctomycetales bacterium]|nr:serine/threonine protein kinase [Planctomycetales bacterium]